eukprot:366196-Chlamydomonas_euryale.AAC.11
MPGCGIQLERKTEELVAAGVTLKCLWQTGCMYCHSSTHMHLGSGTQRYNRCNPGGLTSLLKGMRHERRDHRAVADSAAGGGAGVAGWRLWFSVWTRDE